ncbi:nicastrin-like [Centruroides sculpturatus]|uniref:nicastrin-like n=1 Tax=Centruroides sculpturatus TaxID=218467 RepID=UPI000C6E47B9|nr:nicastrin-like [Centruroides sculpturatus]
MVAVSVLLFGIVNFFLRFSVLSADRTSRKIYETIQANHFCFRRLNATHQIGCSSGRSGNVGVVHLVEEIEDVEWITKTGPYPPYVAVLSMPFFNMANMTNFQSSKRVSGVMILKPEDEEIPSEFSTDRSCPNEYFGLYYDDPSYAGCKKVTWNLPNPVQDIMYKDWNIPIFLITKNNSISKIKNDCFNNFNKAKNGVVRTWPLCSAQLKSVMLAAKDTPTCMRRSSIITNLNPAKLCDPLGSYNIHTMLFPESSNITNRSLIIVGARLDAFSLFDNLAPGGHTAVTGLVTLISIAHTLTKLKEYLKSENLDKNILFTIFNGEAFDYIGSSRMVYDMQKGDFPPKSKNQISFSLEHISHFIEISQLSSSSEVWLHTDPISTGKSEEVNSTVNDLIKELKNQAKLIHKDLTMEEARKDNPVPPASMQSFLKHDKEIAGILISDHSEEFINKYYNSLYDNAETLGITSDKEKLATQLASVAAVLSKTLYKMLSKKEYTEDVIDVSLVSELLECYMVNASCKLFQEINDPDKKGKLREEPYTLYVGVGPSVQQSPAMIFTKYLFSYLTGAIMENASQEICKNDKSNEEYDYRWMAGPNLTGVCVRSTVFQTQALSPAFVLKDWNSKEYSTWTESVWEEASVLIFLQPSRAKEAATLVAGCIISVLSFIIVYFANKRASILFGARNLVSC